MAENHRVLCWKLISCLKIKVLHDCHGFFLRCHGNCLVLHLAVVEYLSGVSRANTDIHLICNLPSSVFFG